ncbi:organelle RRM domain-containing protein 6, chloroplastic-like [Nicotiana tabacum]|uniref:Organelle RRM domain-containing protein 6, chloroplastic-like n=1 Tax=Nicotiana tabacum TaxID=4097 RepID=A0AC58UHD1_TOBAC
MAETPNCTVYVGNLDERVSDRVLYDILVQAGRIVDLYIPRDKENDKPKGFAFAKYETEQIANYAVKLFSGSVTLYSKTLKFAISGQNKPSNSSPMATPRPRPVAYNQKEISPKYMRLSTFCSENEQLDGPILTQLPVDDVFTRDLYYHDMNKRYKRDEIEMKREIAVLKEKLNEAEEEKSKLEEKFK